MKTQTEIITWIKIDSDLDIDSNFDTSREYLIQTNCGQVYVDFPDQVEGIRAIAELPLGWVAPLDPESRAK